MTRMWIVLGDFTNSGGQVVTASPFTDIDGKGVARYKDKASCPAHNGVFAIVGGCDPTTIIDGEPVALHNAILECGCRVLATQQPRVLVDAGSSGASSSPQAPAVHTEGTAILAATTDGTTTAATSKASTAAEASEIAADDGARYDEAFVLISELTGTPLARRRYRIVRADGSHEDGTTDDAGATHVARSAAPELLHIEVGEEQIDA